ncbi:Fic family protein [Methanogenium marinum]|uniref:Fic family protein n=1 Tax=Methanogenium marinum TaxID=348610 RepID=A0A9Q4KUV3_9EURY|nr:Fic family protein [Methanogenium marinum]MDE4907731.1 Fic family protein [Methanogenium marinum]
MAHTDTNTIPAEILLRIEEKRELSSSMPPLSEDDTQKLHEELKLLHTYYSNAIAGSSLTLSETQSIVTEGETIKEKSPQEHCEAMNTATAFEQMERLAGEGTPMSHAMIQGIHEVVTNADPDSSSKYRRTNIKITGAKGASAAKAHPAWTEVMKLMNRLLTTVQNSKLSPIETAAYFYHQFCDIHPFTEGNGRVGRLLTCLYLIEHSYPPVLIKRESRKRYTQLIKPANAGEIGPLSDYIAKAVDESLTLSLAAYGGEDELMPMEDIAERIGEEIDESVGKRIGKEIGEDIVERVGKGIGEDSKGSEDSTDSLCSPASSASSASSESLESLESLYSLCSSVSPEYLNHRAELGVLDAVKIEYTWHTSRRALERYFALHENEEM